MRKLILILLPLFTACGKQDAIISWSALAAYLVIVFITVAVIPTIIKVFDFDPVRRFFESISNLICLITLGIGILLSVTGSLVWLTADSYSAQPTATSFLAIGFGLSFGGYYLKKWSLMISENANSAEKQSILKKVFMLIGFAISTVISIAVMTG